jgi:predicted HTH domain antitoxin
MVLEAPVERRVHMVEITIQLPDKLAEAFGETPSVRSQRVLENTAIEEYRAGRISQREVGAILGFDYWQTERFLAEHNVPINYGLEDLESDRSTLNTILGRP